MKDEYTYWRVGLAEDAEALADLDEMCKRTGLARAEVTRLILLTWSAARRGKVQEMWGFSAGLTLMSTQPIETAKQKQGAPLAPNGKSKKVVSQAAMAAAAGLDLD
jgi:hypothetical protein